MKKQINLSPQNSEGQAYDSPAVNDSRKFKITRKSLEGVVASLEILGDQIQLKVSQTDLDTQLTNYSTITQTATQIATRVATTDYNGNTIASLINQTATTIQISASKINLSGYVTVTNLSTSGQTTINGDNITTGTLNADRINANSLNVNKLQTGTTLGGAGLIAFNSGNITLYGSSINDASLNFNNSGNIVRIYNAGSNTIGVSGVLRCNSSLIMEGQITSNSIIPASNNTYSLGTSSFRYASIWQTSGAVTGSDRVLKKNIEEIDEAVALIKELRPVRYVMKDGSSGRPHYGFIAQEVKQALDKVGRDSGVYIDPVVKEIPENGSGYAKGLRYEEFIAPTIAVVKDLLKRVEDLENGQMQGSLQALAS